MDNFGPLLLHLFNKNVIYSVKRLLSRQLQVIKIEIFAPSFRFFQDFKL